jgi:signal transduction histidine kinase
MILCIPVFFQWSVGGFSPRGATTIVFWSLLAPFGALMFQGMRKALWWFIIFLVLVVVSLILDEYFVRFATEITHREIVVGKGINIIGLSVTIFLTMMYFVNAFQKEHDRAENLVVDLTETNSELEATIHELSETQAELVQSEKMGALGKLAAGIAHEINNPIGALKSTASTSARCLSKLEQIFEESGMIDKIKSDVNFQNYFQILKDNSRVFETVSDRVSNSVSSFIDFARLDKAGLDKFDIHGGIDNTLTLIQHEIKALTSIVKEYGDIPRIVCYPGELNQVFMNLLTNAAQAIEDKGSITIGTFVERAKLHIQIQDTGVGIPRERIQGLFDPGFSKKGIRVRAGLGLFTSYNIVKKHRGEIKVESEVGKGSTFTIVLPTNLDMIINEL